MPASLEPVDQHQSSKHPHQRARKGVDYKMLQQVYPRIPHQKCHKQEHNTPTLVSSNNTQQTKQCKSRGRMPRRKAIKLINLNPLNEVQEYVLALKKLAGAHDVIKKHMFEKLRQQGAHPKAERHKSCPPIRIEKQDQGHQHRKGAVAQMRNPLKEHIGHRRIPPIDPQTQIGLAITQLHTHKPQQQERIRPKKPLVLLNQSKHSILIKACTAYYHKNL